MRMRRKIDMRQQAREQRDLQETKLIPPVRRGATIERRRILGRALAGSNARLLLVLGAAGFGKTNVLSRVYRELSREHRVGWISLDQGDNDHARFLLHLAESFRNHHTDLRTVIPALLGSGATPTPSVQRSTLLNALAHLDGELHIFLDDYHLVTNEEVRETVNAMATATLPGVHLLIASRTRNELPLGRLRSLGQLVEIVGEDLAFSIEETREFLAGTCAGKLDPQQIEWLHTRTEGWAASLQLASIALEQVSDPREFLRDFSGETRSVGDFLGEEVMQRQPPELQQFLMDTSILERFDAAKTKSQFISNALLGFSSTGIRRNSICNGSSIASLFT